MKTISIRDLHERTGFARPSSSAPLPWRNAASRGIWSWHARPREIAWWARP